MGLVESYKNLRKLDSTKMKPFSGDTDHRTLADVARQALGVSEDSYNFKPGIDDALDTALKKVAYQAGIHPSQAKILTEALVTELDKLQASRSSEKLDSYKKAISNEEGADYDKIVSERLSKAGKDFETTKKALGNEVYNPDILKLLTGDVSTSTLPTSDKPAFLGQKDKVSASDKIKDLRNNPAYYDTSHADHQKLQNEMISLMNQEAEETPLSFDELIANQGGSISG